MFKNVKKSLKIHLNITQLKSSSFYIKLNEIPKINKLQKYKFNDKPTIIKNPAIKPKILNPANINKDVRTMPNLNTSSDNILEDEIDSVELNKSKTQVLPINNKEIENYLSIVKFFQIKSFENIYSLNAIEMIKQKIVILKKELKSMIDLNSRKQGDNKTQNLVIDKNDSIINTETHINNSDGEFRDIFLSKSIKEIELKIKDMNFTLSQLNDVEFKFNLLNFYSNINIDKAFEYFYDNIYNDGIDFDKLNLSYIKKFIERLVELDKVKYLQVIYLYIIRYDIELSAIYTDEEFTRVFYNFFEYHMPSHYENTILGLKFLFKYISEFDSSTSKSNVKYNKPAAFAFSVDFSEVFDSICDKKFKSRKMNDEIIELIKIYAKLDEDNKATNNNVKIHFKDESLAKIFTLYFDNSANIKDDIKFPLFDLIFMISNKNIDFIEHLKDHLTAYFQYFGFAPKILSGENLKKVYHCVKQKLSTSSLEKKFTENEIEFFILLFKYNNMPEYICDVLNNWSSLSSDRSKSNKYKFALCDYLLNSNLNENNYYHKKIENVYLKMDFSYDSLVLRTLAYLKDGNKEYAINNFFKELDSNVKKSTLNDKALLELYKKTFENDFTKDYKFITQENTVFADDDKNKFNQEFQYTLMKIESIENIKQSIQNLFNYFKTENLENKIQVQEKVLDVIKSLNRASKNLYIEKERSSINYLVNKINNAKLEDFPINENKAKDTRNIDDLYSEIKVNLYLDDSMYNLISDALERNISYINDIKNLEFDSTDKQNLISSIDNFMRYNPNLRNNEKKFLNLVSDYLRLKPESYNRMIFLTEDTIRSTVDEDSLFGYGKLQEYIITAKKFYKFMNQKYSRNKINYALDDGLKCLKDAGINLQQEIRLKNSKSSTLDEKIKIYGNIISNYEKILNNLLKEKININLSKKYKFYNGNLYDSSIKMLISNQLDNDPRANVNKSQLINKIGKNLAKLSDRFIYHNLITLNKIKNLRQKNIIKAFYNKNKSTSNQVKSTCYHPMLNLISNNIYYSTLKSLKNLDTLEVNNEDSIFLQESFTQLCQTNNIDIPQPQTIKEKITITEPKESSSAWGKLLKMRELLNQDSNYFTIKHAIYMIIFGAENNLPEAIRIGEKVCSDYGYILPTWVETRVNKYLVHHSQEYSLTVNRIGPINVANVYRRHLSKDSLFDNHGVESSYDSYKAPSIYAVDYLPFNGLEEIVDLKKFSMLMKNLNKSNDKIL